MPKPTKAVQRACQVLRHKVRFKSAALRLPGQDIGADDTEKIRDATRIYVETWIVPIIDAIETGNTWLLNSLCQFNRGDEME